MIKVSTIITFYRGQFSYLKELIHSIEIAMNKLVVLDKVVHHSLIIINDSVNREIETSLENLVKENVDKNITETIFIHNSHNLGIIKSRLRGLMQVHTSDMVHIIDQDDKMDENFYYNAYKLLKSDNNLGFVVAGTVISINEFNEPISKTWICKDLNNLNNEKKLKKNIYGGSNFFYSMGSLIFNYSVIKSIINLFEKFDRDIDGADDYLVQIFLLKKGYRYKIDDKIIFYYRIHSENHTKKIRKEFYNKNLKGLLLLKDLGLISEKELQFYKKITESRSILWKRINKLSPYDIVKLALYFPALVKYTFYNKLYKPNKKVKISRSKNKFIKKCEIKKQEN